MPSKTQRLANGNFQLAETPSHLMRRCEQFYADLYAREAGNCDLTRSQMTVLAALDPNEGASQTALVEMTGIDRSTLAEMVRRMMERGLITRKRTETDLRANAGHVEAILAEMTRQNLKRDAAIAQISETLAEMTLHNNSRDTAIQTLSERR